MDDIGRNDWNYYCVMCSWHCKAMTSDELCPHGFRTEWKEVLLKLI